jgi:hypothetical protein
MFAECTAIGSRDEIIAVQNQAALMLKRLCLTAGSSSNIGCTESHNGTSALLELLFATTVLINRIDEALELVFPQFVDENEKNGLDDKRGGCARFTVIYIFIQTLS